MKIRSPCDTQAVLEAFVKSKAIWNIGQVETIKIVLLLAIVLLIWTVATENIFLFCSNKNGNIV